MTQANVLDFVKSNWSVKDCEEFINAYSREDAIKNGESEYYDAAYEIAFSDHTEHVTKKN